MFYVYLLRSNKDNRIYTGFTSNLRRRISEHFNKENYTTLRMEDVELIYYEAFTNKCDALEREDYLKTTKGKRTIKLMLKNTLAPIV
ncbi:excinuclease ABC subunit C [Candidatus Roizmanbacteria bacterium CG_4_10_14_3_um_filter_33_21]|uniref:Excinuclease ABC subunit C n=1 Tax=Candidatus Roizmanbacteria bacterium CG_4_10_14_3_um_filter_33_21 TaxID=1974830 RepID=A0A2M7M167_9BACT|nr:MAG: excinuclease ABC subunit C [Candidatus Roizmanbacteria bacterium CG_4_10_14_3_um_filter_33_21]